MSTLTLLDSPISSNSAPLRLVAHGTADIAAAATLTTAVRAATSTASADHLVVVDVSDVYFVDATALRAVDRIRTTTATEAVLVVGLSSAAQEVLRINDSIAAMGRLRPLV